MANQSEELVEKPLQIAEDTTTQEVLRGEMRRRAESSCTNAGQRSFIGFYRRMRDRRGRAFAHMTKINYRKREESVCAGEVKHAETGEIIKG